MEQQSLPLQHSGRNAAIHKLLVDVDGQTDPSDHDVHGLCSLFLHLLQNGATVPQLLGNDIHSLSLDLSVYRLRDASVSSKPDQARSEGREFAQE